MVEITEDFNKLNFKGMGTEIENGDFVHATKF